MSDAIKVLNEFEANDTKKTTSKWGHFFIKLC
jgi:hypothetical protein